MKLFLLHWSRNLHKWLGIYAALLTLVWLCELMLLPGIYNPAPLPATPSHNHTTAGSNGIITINDILSRLDAGEYGEPLSSVEIRYNPNTKQYTIFDQDRFVNIRVDAFSGEPIDHTLDFDALFMEKAALGWAHPTLSLILKTPFEFSFVILALTGIYIILFPHMKRKKKNANGLLGMRPGQQFRFQSTQQPADMCRMAALGLLPGVCVEVMRIPSRGPVILSARHTRLAIGKDIAATFIIDKEGF
ncbi:MAG: ferrous iron transport protein A [Pseudodesulfovibrio sp.]|nr:ferrous iron transport protein A [Pseudodesulfovibrio sp.]